MSVSIYMRILKPLAAAVCASLLLSLSFAIAGDASKPEGHGIAVANIDRSVDPGNDFYAYANGAWLERTQIPVDRSAIGVFSQLGDLADKRASALIEEAAKS